MQRSIRSMSLATNTVMTAVLAFCCVGAFRWSADAQTVTQVQTSYRNANRFTKLAPLTFKAVTGTSPVTITIDPATKYQTMTGFGGSFTEAGATVLNQIPAAKRKEILDAYFGPTGADYSVCRTHINSCDFSLTNYSYDETAGDTGLKNFNIAPDTGDLIPFIKDALARNPDLRIFASPWSPPAWMKTNNSMAGGSLRAEDYKAWALYFVKYINAYRDRGIPMWGITIQNESEFAAGWGGCVYTPQQQRDFLKNNLGPTLANLPVKIMFYDHNYDDLMTWADVFHADAAAAKYVWGIAFHWYGGWFSSVGDVHAKYPSGHILGTEACITGGPHLNEWSNAETYAMHIFGTVQGGAEGWVDWNMVLDMQGGPNKDGNYCSAGIHANPGTGAITYNPQYYYMAQVSRYVRPGAVRVKATTSGNGAPDVLAFVNPDGTIAVLVHQGGTAEYDARIVVGNQQINYHGYGWTMDDFVWQGPTTVSRGDRTAMSLTAPRRIAMRTVIGMPGAPDARSTAYSITGKAVTAAGRGAKPGAGCYLIGSAK